MDAVPQRQGKGFAGALETGVAELAFDAGRARAAAEGFVPDGVPTDLQPLGNGLINDTFLVQSRGAHRLVLQRINRHVFPDPPAIMHNLRVIQEHLRGESFPDRKAVGGFVLPGLIPTREGQDYLVDDAGDFWRALEYIEGTVTLESIDNEDRAEQVGQGLGRFHRLFSGLDPEKLRDTLPGFHVTPRYLEGFRAVLGEIELRRVREIRVWEELIEQRAERAGVLERARAEGKIPVRVVHGDPKLNNFLFRRYGHRVASLIDLDTVKPGLIHHDLGDCLRSCCNTAGELLPVGGSVLFDLDIAAAILRGYMTEAGAFMRAEELAWVASAIWLIPFELGVRFLTDYLRGNQYFKVTEPQQNLQRAVTQFRLMESIERSAAHIEQIVAELHVV